MRKKIIAANWKMNKTYQQGLELASEVINMVKDEVTSDAVVVLCPPFIHLHAVARLAAGANNVFAGAQNCYTEASGAYTGETSAEMIASTGADYVIIGHSERRDYFSEGSQTLTRKVELALANGLTPIFCCGESQAIREGSNFIDYVCNQLEESLFGFDADVMRKIVIAYEPIWAIGTGLTASSAQAQEMHQALRRHLAGKYGEELANQIPILYGGSVKASNAAELFACPDVDGGLVGGASLQSREFANIVKAMA